MLTPFILGLTLILIQCNFSCICKILTDVTLCVYVVKSMLAIMLLCLFYFILQTLSCVLMSGQVVMFIYTKWYIYITQACTTFQPISAARHGSMISRMGKFGEQSLGQDLSKDTDRDFR